MAASESAASSFGNSDYLYYMNEAGARGGAYLAGLGSGSTSMNGGSPSRGSGDSQSGHFDPYADQEDSLFKEKYPGKLCALCNLSERSALGQGEIVRYKVANEADLLTLIKEKRKAANLEDDSAESPSLEKSPSLGGNSNARRKGRKITSGDVNEPVDELENVGFSEEPEHSLVFESSGHFFAHYQCALWSFGVRIKKDDTASTSTESPSKEKTLIGVEKAVINAMYQKCAHCKHFGASVKCKASGRYYHYPCGYASGSFMQKHTRLLIGTESLKRVADLGRILFCL